MDSLLKPTNTDARAFSRRVQERSAESVCAEWEWRFGTLEEGEQSEVKQKRFAVRDSARSVEMAMLVTALLGRADN